MKRIAVTVLLTAAAAVVNITAYSPVVAEELYRWTEADGSMTFSPNRPPAGVEFVKVEPAKGLNASEANIERSLAVQDVATPDPRPQVQATQSVQSLASLQREAVQREVQARENDRGGAGVCHCLQPDR